VSISLHTTPEQTFSAGGFSLHNIEEPTGPVGAPGRRTVLEEVATFARHIRATGRTGRPAPGGREELLRNDHPMAAHFRHLISEPSQATET
jgi:hypothetical protein